MPLHNWSEVESGIYHAFHTSWISEIQFHLNGGVLPSDYYALAEQHAGNYVTDVLTLHTPPKSQDLSPPPPPPPLPSPADTIGGVAVTDAPPQVKSKETLELEIRAMTRSISIRHISTHRVVALLEIVSPGKKDRPENVEKFAYKTATALEQGIQILVIYPFEPRKFDPHGIDYEIRRWIVPTALKLSDTIPQPANLISYAIGKSLDVYSENISVGEAFPDMPLFLQPELYVNVPLESTYMSAWRGMPKFWKEIIVSDSQPS